MLNRAERELLTVARQEVEADGQFICIALRHAAVTLVHKKYERGYRRLELYIHNAIGGRFPFGSRVLDDWVKAKVGGRMRDDDPLYEERMTATRLAWVDWMLEE
jgi:hypothetical protein